MKAAVIGCGNRGLIAARADVEAGLNVCLGVDPFMDARASFAAVAPGSSVASELSSVVDESVDIVHVTTPATLRVEVVKHCVSWSPKVIIVEKPLASTYQQAEAIAGMCEDAGALLVVNHQQRYLDEIRAIGGAIARGELGEIERVLLWSRFPFLSQATHLIDTLLFLLGDATTPTWVLAQVEGAAGFADPLSLSPDTVTALIGLDCPTEVHLVSGERSRVADGREEWTQMGVDVLGSLGRATARLDEGHELWTAGKHERRTTEWDGQELSTQRRLMMDVLEVRKGNKPVPDIWGRGALIALEIYEAALQSAMTHRAIALPLSSSPAVYEHAKSRLVAETTDLLAGCPQADRLNASEHPSH